VFSPHIVRGKTSNSTAPSCCLGRLKRGSRRAEDARLLLHGLRRDAVGHGPPHRDLHHGASNVRLLRSSCRGRLQRCGCGRRRRHPRRGRVKHLLRRGRSHSVRPIRRGAADGRHNLHPVCCDVVGGLGDGRSSDGSGDGFIRLQHCCRCPDHCGINNGAVGAHLQHCDGGLGTSNLLHRVICTRLHPRNCTRVSAIPPRLGHRSHLHVGQHLHVFQGAPRLPHLERRGFDY